MNHFMEFAGQNFIWVLVLFILIIAFFVLDMRTKSGGSGEVSPDEAVMLTNRQKAKLLDIRPQEAFDAGHIADAKPFDAAKFDDAIVALKKHKNAPIVVVCERGQTAKGVSAKLKKAGFDAKVLAGGMTAWKKAGMPVVTD